MANFMLNDDAHNKSTHCDGKTLLPGACSAAACPLFSLFAAHNNITKDVHTTENSSQKGQKFSNKIILDVDIQDQDNNMQSNNNSSLPDASLDFLAATPLFRPRFANNSLNESIKSKYDYWQDKCTLREVRLNLANSSLYNDATDMKTMSVPVHSCIKLLIHNKRAQNQQQGQQSIPIINISEIITGKVPFSHPNTSNTKYPQVMDEESLKANNHTRLSALAAVAPSTCSISRKQ